MQKRPAPGARRPDNARWASVRWLRKWVQYPLHGSLENVGRGRRLLASNVRIFFLVARVEVYDRLKLHAQALTYDTLLALIPFLAVLFASVRAVGVAQDIGARIEALVINNISGGPQMQKAVGEYLSTFTGNISEGEIGAVSILILIYSVMSLLGHIEFAFNSIFGSKTGRSLVIRLLTYWAVLTLGPVLLAASFALTAALQTSSIGAVVEDLTLVKRGLVWMLPMVITWLAFFTMYLVVPHTRVRLTAALPAAIIAGSLWNCAKYFYAIYAKNAFTLQSIYGSLAAIPLFIFWLYVSWLLVLFGAQLAFAFQHAASYRREDGHSEVSQGLRELAACRLLVDVAREFYAGRSAPSADDLAATLHIPRRLLGQLVSELVDGGFLREIEESGGLLPAVDLDRITVSGVLSHLRRRGTSADPELAADGATEIIQELLDRSEQARDAVTANVSFRVLAARLEGDAPIVPEAPPQADSR